MNVRHGALCEQLFELEPFSETASMHGCFAQPVAARSLGVRGEWPLPTATAVTTAPVRATTMPNVTKRR